MKASLEFESVEFLERFFPEFKPQLSKVQFIGTISVFSFFFESEAYLNDKWESITSSIAVNYQSEFEDEEQEFERWNIYIFFVVKGSVDSQLKYKIENDKFSSRKIIQDNIEEALNPNSISELIQKHIVHSDLNKSVIDNGDISDAILSYSSNSTVYKIIESYHSNDSGKRVSRGANKGSSRRVSRGIGEDDLNELYQQIVKEIEDETLNSQLSAKK